MENAGSLLLIDSSTGQNLCFQAGNRGNILVVFDWHTCFIGNMLDRFCSLCLLGLHLPYEWDVVRVLGPSSGILSLALWVGVKYGKRNPCSLSHIHQELSHCNTELQPLTRAWGEREPDFFGHTCPYLNFDHPAEMSKVEGLDDDSYITDSYITVPALIDI